MVRAKNMTADERYAYVHGRMRTRIAKAEREGRLSDELAKMEQDVRAWMPSLFQPRRRKKNPE